MTRGRPRSDRFDWNSDESVLVKPRPGVAAYRNEAGNVVFRKQNLDGGADYCIELTVEEMHEITKALNDLRSDKPKGEDE